MTQNQETDNRNSKRHLNSVVITKDFDNYVLYTSEHKYNDQEFFQKAGIHNNKSNGNFKNFKIQHLK